MHPSHTTKTVVGMAILTLAAVAALRVEAQQETPPAVRLIAEAEDFTLRSKGWSIVPYRENYFASTFAITFLSRMACLGAPEQMPPGEKAVAEQSVEIPTADTFEVLARYEQPWQFSCEFTVEIEQKGKVAARLACGKLDSPKFWAFKKGETSAMERFWWGDTDNIVWQHPGSVKLEAGPAIIRLIAEEQKDGSKQRINAARRNVDVIVLTNDKDGMAAQKKTGYLPFDGWLTQDGDIFARLTNRGDKPAAPRLAPCNHGQHSPYYIHMRDWTGVQVLGKGIIMDAQKYKNYGPRSSAVKTSKLAPELSLDAYLPQDDANKGKAKPVFPEADKLQPGKTSGWAPIGQMMDALHDSIWELKTDVPMEVEFGVSDGKGGIRSVCKTAAQTAETFEIPGNAAPNSELTKILRERWWLPEIRTVTQSLSWLKNEIDKFPKVGRVPERFLIYSIGGFGDTPNSPEGQALMAALGDNTGGNQWKGKKRGLVHHWSNTSPDFFTKQDLSDIRVVSYGDETHLPAKKISDEEFAAWLKARGVKYAGQAQWTDKPADPLYYYSKLAGIEEGAKSYIQATAHYKSKGALAGVNYSPHANYLVSDINYVLPFKLQALSMAWSEDYVWQVPEFSVQAVGYLTTAFRCGVKYHNQPILMYVMPHSPGNTPKDFRRSFYTCTANGATIINYFCASPLAVGGTENYVATSDLPMWREIHRCTHEAGLFEDYVMDAKIRPAKIGMLLSSVEDIWSHAANGTLALHNNERKAIYYALKHAQIPLDMITEDDVIDGSASKLDVIYVTQQWMHSKCAEALKKWVEKGGTLVALCGGGFMDEFNRPSAAAAELYGVTAAQPTADPNLVKRYLTQENIPFLSKQDLPFYEPMDMASWSLSDDSAGINNVPVIAWKQQLTPKSATVLGKFKNGAPALTLQTHGKGKAYLFAFLPGQAYIKSGLPMRPADRGSTDDAMAHFLPTAMDRKLRALLTDDFLPANFQRPVSCSEDLVETSCFDTPAQKGNPARLAVPLINYTPQPMPELTVKIADVPKASAVRSLVQGALKPTFDGKTMIVTLPLETADMLLIDR